jgi:hypothetical protein
MPKVPGGEPTAASDLDDGSASKTVLRNNHHDGVSALWMKAKLPVLDVGF